MKNKWYHASPRRLKVGTVLTPFGKDPNFGASGYFPTKVYITSSPVPHFTIMDKALKEGWHVYEVRPKGKVEKGIWDDGIVDFAIVIQHVGSARGIASRWRAKYKDKENAYGGSIARLGPTRSRAFQIFEQQMNRINKTK